MANFRIYNDQLCPDMWDTAQHLDPVVRVNLLRMAYDFYEKTKLPAPIVDVYLMGSIANYNWTSDSDADVHVIINYSQLQMPEETAAKTVKTAGAQWNLEHNVTVKGHKVEMNLQNASEQKPYVTGIYSLVKDQWIRKPILREPQVNKNLIRVQFQSMKNYINAALNSRNRDTMKAAKKYLDAYRQYGLDTCGELSYENIVFKILRARGLIKQLKDAITATYDQEMTVDESDYIGSTYWKQTGVPVPDALKTVHGAHGMVSGVNSQNWRYLEKKNKVLWNTKPNKTDMDTVTKFLSQHGISAPMHKVMHKEGLAEVGEKDIKQTLPAIDPKFSRDYWDKFDRETNEFRLDRLTMDELKALREKAFRLAHGFEVRGKPQWAQIPKQDFVKYDAELKRRLAAINKPLTEANKPTRIKWVREDEDEPYFKSVDGRFSITPLYIGRVKAQAYYLTDNQTGKKFHEGTLALARDRAERIMNPGPPPAPPLPPEQLQAAYDKAIASNQPLFAADIAKNALKYRGITLKTVDKPQEPVEEGYGAGIPEKDRLKIKNTDGSTRRWQIRSKDAPKTPKMTDEIVIAIPKFDPPQKNDDDDKS